MKSAEGRGRTLDEAVDAALIELGESRRNVDVKVLNEGPEETLVEVTVMDQASSVSPSAAPVDGKAEVARTLVEGLLKHMGIRAQVTTRTGTEPITLDISGRDLGALIGWRGETLRALQSVTNVMVARHLAEGLSQIKGITLDPKKVVTNIVIFDVRPTGRPAAEICAALGKEGILCGPTDKYSIRMVTHYDVDRAGIDRAIAALRGVLENRAPAAAAN